MISEDLKIQVVFFSFLIIFAFFLLIFVAVLTYRLQNQKRSICPYTKKPMWRGEDVPISSIEKIMSFLYYDNHSYYNKIFLMKESMICRDTGRIFQDTVSFWGFSKVDWSFIQKRYPGTYVSWGSLSLQQQRDVREAHSTLEGFQTEKSSPKLLPQDIEEEYIYLKPGPLYVDIMTKVLIGWKCVPDTIFEVLIVQRPVRKIHYSKDVIRNIGIKNKQSRKKS